MHSLLEKRRSPQQLGEKNLQHIDEDTKADKAAGISEANAIHSRLLTKRQLSDMAWGVRELSKRLGSVRLKLKVKTVFLLTKAHDEDLIKITREVVEWLLSEDRNTPYIVYVEQSRKEYSVLTPHRYVEDTLEHNSIFNAESIVGQHPSREGRLRYWNNDLCRKHPLTFDFVVTVKYLATTYCRGD